MVLRLLRDLMCPLNLSHPVEGFLASWENLETSSCWIIIAELQVTLNARVFHDLLIDSALCISLTCRLRLPVSLNKKQVCSATNNFKLSNLPKSNTTGEACKLPNVRIILVLQICSHQIVFNVRSSLLSRIIPIPGFQNCSINLEGLHSGSCYNS